jgi:hypothetical protein
LIWMFSFWFVGMLYGVIAVLSGNPLPRERILPAVAVLFLLGIWAGVVCLTDSERWPSTLRRTLNAVTFAALGFFAASVLARPSGEQLLLVTAICLVVGYLGEWWVKHV